MTPRKWSPHRKLSFSHFLIVYVVHTHTHILYICLSRCLYLSPQVRLQSCNPLMVTGSPCRAPSIPGPVCWPSERVLFSVCWRKNQALCPRMMRWALIQIQRTRGAGGLPCYSFADVSPMKRTILTLNTTLNGHTPNTHPLPHLPQVSTPTLRLWTQTRRRLLPRPLEPADQPTVWHRRRKGRLKHTCIHPTDIPQTVPLRLYWGQRCWMWTLTPMLEGTVVTGRSRASRSKDHGGAERANARHQSTAEHIMRCTALPQRWEKLQPSGWSKKS